MERHRRLSSFIVSGVAAAADKPDWAFPVTEKVLPAPRFEGTRVRPAPPSTLSITRAKADDMYDIPNGSEPGPVDAKIVNSQTGYAGARMRIGAISRSAQATTVPHMWRVFGRLIHSPDGHWKSGARKFSATMVAMSKVVTDVGGLRKPLAD